MENTPAKATSTPLKIGDRVRMEITQGLPIRDLQNVEPLKNAFKFIFVLIGLRPDKLPNEESKQVLIDFCRRRFGNYKHNELVLAFEMAISGDFKADTDHFGQFTAKYLSLLHI